MTLLDWWSAGSPGSRYGFIFIVYDACDIKLERGVAGCRSRGDKFPVTCCWQGAKNSDTPEMPLGSCSAH